MYALVVGGASLFIAGVAVLRVQRAGAGERRRFRAHQSANQPNVSLPFITDQWPGKEQKKV